MKITDVRIRTLNEAQRLKAIVSITFDDCFTVHDIKIVEGKDRIIVAMPSRKTPEGEFKDIAHPINAETRKEIEEAILEKYNEALAEVVSE